MQFWRPIFKRHGLRLHRSCPFHAARDSYGPQEASKRFYRSDLWVCSLSGKAFLTHAFLDLHIAREYKDALYTVKTLSLKVEVVGVLAAVAFFCGQTKVRTVSIVFVPAAIAIFQLLLLRLSFTAEIVG